MWNLLFRGQPTHAVFFFFFFSVECQTFAELYAPEIDPTFDTQDESAASGSVFAWFDGWNEKETAGRLVPVLE